MGNAIRFVGIIVGLVIVGSVFADKARFDEHNTLIREKGTIGPLDGAMFGDSISYYAGGLSFTQTDTSIPGNNALPVAVTRTYSVTGHRHPNANLAFADWDIELPSIGGVYATSTGWVRTAPGGYTTARCSVPTDLSSGDILTYARPPLVNGGIDVYEFQDYWNGVQVNIPGRGSQDVLLNEYGHPTSSGLASEPPGVDGEWRWTAADQTFFSCLSAVQNAAGEGFFAIDAQGTTYRFDWMAATRETSLRDPGCDPWGACAGSTMDRKRYRLYATRVEDRFGNFVNYTYTNAAEDPVRLTGINSSDGRSISLTYNAQGNVSTVTENSRTWTYTYDYADGATLTSVGRPDGTSWGFDFGTLSDLEVRAEPPEAGTNWDCRLVRPVAEAEAVGVVTHPSGAVGEFRVAPRLFGRTMVPLACSDYSEPYYNVYGGDPIYPKHWWSPAVISKKTSGAGLPIEEWTYEYGGESGFDETSDGTPVVPATGESWAVVHGPGGTWTRYTFGNRFLKDEGLLKRTEVGTGPSNVLRTEIVNHFTDPDSNGGDPFFYLAGMGIAPFNGSFSVEARRPQLTRQVQQQGVVFTWEADVFDAWARPLSVTKYSTGSVGEDGTRTEVTTYHDDEDAWVLGQIASIVSAGKTAVSRTFDPTTALPLTEHRFGWLRDTLEWNPDGTLKTVSDGAGKLTSLSSWKRGIPQSITYADGTGTMATVNDRGEITSITNEFGDVHSYQYDYLGRLTRIDYPAGDPVLWAPTTYSLVRGGFSLVGISDDHWRYTVATGNLRKDTYLDARFRPVLTHEYDIVDWDATDTFVERRFDHENRETFVSYPGDDGISYGGGITTQYDVLGRPTGTLQTSELGPLTTSIEYLSGFTTRETDARGAQTTTEFQVFDEPDTSYPIRIVAPESQQTLIARDAFGKPLSIARGGIVRQYVYDENERLCQRIDPESGATVNAYDASGNVAWSASGLIPDPADCPRASVAEAEKSYFSYDSRNRPTLANHPGTDADIDYVYAQDGALTGISSGTTAWLYEYNRRRLLTKETFNHDGGLYVFGKAYNTSGQLYAESYPGDLIVEYAPDARGRPTQAGDFATGAQYHASGALAQFTYGNGIVRTVAENTRRMPSRVSDLHAGAGFHDWAYLYDANGNLTSVVDYDIGEQDRQMTYDMLGRLESVSAPNLWGLASYDYDALDNITSAVLQSGPHARAYDYVYDASNRLSAINEAGGTAHSFGHDARGNQTLKTTGAASQTRVFDHANRLTGITGIAQYRYDGHGRRSAVDRDDGTTQENIYTLDGVLRVQRDESKNEKKSYVYLGGTLVGWVDDFALPPDAAPAISAPSNNYTGSYTVSWTEVTAATRYELEEYVSSWQPVLLDNPDDLAKEFSGKANGTYKYRVRACNSNGCAADSATVTTVVSLPPDQPALTAPSTNHTGSFSVSWTSEATAVRYQLQQKINSDSWATIQNTSSTSRPISVTVSATYYYRVRACSSSSYLSCSAFSTTKSTVVSPPPAPTLSAPISDHSGSFTVSWTSTSGAATYKLQRNKNGSTWATIADSGGNTMVQSGLKTGTYGFRVYACNTALGCGAHSPIKFTEVTSPPETAPSLSAPSLVYYPNSFTVSWTTVATATSYQLFERKNGGSWAKVYDGTGTSTSRLRNQGYYEYRGRGCNIAGCGPYSAIVATSVEDTGGCSGFGCTDPNSEPTDPPEEW